MTVFGVQNCQRDQCYALAKSENIVFQNNGRVLLCFGVLVFGGWGCFVFPAVLTNSEMYRGTDLETQ